MASSIPLKGLSAVSCEHQPMRRYKDSSLDNYRPSSTVSTASSFRQYPFPPVPTSFATVTSTARATLSHSSSSPPLPARQRAAHSLRTAALCIFAFLASSVVADDGGDPILTNGPDSAKPTFQLLSNCVRQSGTYLEVGNQSALTWDDSTVAAGDSDFNVGFVGPDSVFHALLSPANNASFSVASKTWPFKVPDLSNDNEVSFTLTGTYLASPSGTISGVTPGALTSLVPFTGVRFLQPGEDCPSDPSETINILYIVPPILAFIVLVLVGVLISWLYRRKLERRMAKGKAYADGPNKPVESPPSPLLAWLYPADPEENPSKKRSRLFGRSFSKAAAEDEDMEKGDSPGTKPAADGENSSTHVVAADNLSSGTSATSTPSLTSAASKSTSGSGAADSTSSSTAAVNETSRPPAAAAAPILYDSDEEEESTAYRIGADGRRVHRVRLVYSGTPERHVGGSSSWRPPQPVNQRHKVVFPHAADSPDEMRIVRGEVVIVQQYFEDGWVLAKREAPARVAGQSTQSLPTPTWSTKKGKETGTKAAAAAATNPSTKQVGVIPYHCLHVLHDDVIMVFPERYV
ncbi:hypothetical protein DFJ73DRAFT_78515 [Zopfochytrium polystomum]|nr:hypothetical protein DFJ73DRAFT_78515 [Zopfochytrium polystomum]